MKEWIEVIRDANFFNLLVENTDVIDTNLTDFTFNIDTGRGPITVQYDSLRTINKDIAMPNAPAWIAANAPTWIAASEATSLATPDSCLNNIIPHAVEPAPAQRAGNIAFIWGKQVSDEIVIHREDGFPAVIIAVGLNKHYHYGKLHRKRQHAAIKAEYLTALWYNTPGELSRGNGPASISIENYKEFWVDGEFKGHRWTNYDLRWRHRMLDTPGDEDTLGMFLDNLVGTTNMFSDVYFTDGQDEVCYLTDFA